jgi:hypothetical protein
LMPAHLHHSTLSVAHIQFFVTESRTELCNSHHRQHG